MESYYWKKSRKTLNESAAITEVICQMYLTKWEATESTPSQLLLLSMSKKVKEALRTTLSQNKITWTETFVGSKKIAKWKTTLNWGTLACYENLLIKSHYKNKGIFFVCNRNPPSPKLSRFRSLHCLFSNNSGNTNHKHLPLIGTNHCDSRLSENIHF